MCPGQVVCIIVLTALATAACGGTSTTDTSGTPATTVTSVDTLGTEANGTDSPWPTPLGGGHHSWTVSVERVVNHDPDAFTQGLEWTGAGILEGTGRRGESTLRLLDDVTGDVLDSRELDDGLFGEGITVVGDEIIQLTWTSGLALRYDATTFEPLGSYSFSGQGWGLCFDGDVLWMSDGSERLTRRDAQTFEWLDDVVVRHEGALVAGLNELECIDEHVVANVWKSNDILVIDPFTGVVDATIDASTLADDVDLVDSTAVLNGIADLGDGTLLLAGKLWPRHFVVRLVPAAEN